MNREKKSEEFVIEGLPSGCSEWREVGYADEKGSLNPSKTESLALERLEMLKGDLMSNEIRGKKGHNWSALRLVRRVVVEEVIFVESIIDAPVSGK